MKRFTLRKSLYLFPTLLLSVIAVTATATESFYSRLHRLGALRGPQQSMRTVGAARSLREFPRRVYPTMDITREVTGVDRLQSGSSDLIPFTGKGVTIAVIDAGIDPTHIAFSRRGEGSRVVRYLRTTSAAESDQGEVQIQEFTDMSALTRADIDTTTESHGTHTAGTAAGTTEVSPYAGIAPDADLFLVSMGYSLYDDEIAAGLHSAMNYADQSGNPLVMSLSLGSAVGSHRGDNPLTESLRDYPSQGRITLFAAGNDGMNNISLQRDFAEDPEELATGMARVFTGTPAQHVYTEIYSLDSKEFEVGFAVISLEGERREVWRSRFLTAADFDEQGDCLVLDSQTQECLLPGLSSYFQGLIALGLETEEDAPFSMGLYADFGNLPLEHPYVLAMLLRSPQGASVMAVTDFSCANFKSYGVEGYVTGDPRNSISDYCTSPLVVSVGAWNARDSWTDISDTQHPLVTSFYGDYQAPGLYSSYGYVRGTDSRLPHLLAPGTDVISSMQSQYLADDAAFVTNINGREYNWGAMTGTSMATPAMAGIVALWLEACPTLTRDDIIEVIAATSAHDESTLQAPQGSAYGKVNAYDGLRYILTTLSLPGTVTDNYPDKLMVRHLGGGEVECAVPFSCTEGSASVYTAQGSHLFTRPLTDGAVRFHLPSGVHIVTATAPQGTASQKIVIP